jgi:biopolymer transport protein ExbD
MSQATHAEPDFTPLLDVVLQLLMFFIMCVRFVPNQATELIKLPDAKEGHVVELSDTHTIFLNVRPYNEDYFRKRYSSEEWADFPKDLFKPGDPCIFLFSKKEWPYTPASLKRRLEEAYADEHRVSQSGEVPTVIVIRADRDTEYSTVYTILKDCRTIGFRKLKLRAFKQSGR